ncbi:MAG TPA: helix-turn-helix transcriptional regulator [Thermoanaerobacter sp.]|nr:helix-turn-helix transcriptional regulator [Thermoanaerobacter sp.]
MNSIISELKYRYNLTEQELAKRIGISRSQLYRIKKGKSQPGSKFITSLKNAFPDIDLNELVNFKQTEEGH